MTMLHLLTRKTPASSGQQPQLLRLRSWKDYCFHAEVDWALLNLDLKQAAPLEQVAACFAERFLGIASLSGTQTPTKSIAVKIRWRTGMYALDTPLAAIEERWGLSREPQVVACQVALEVLPGDVFALPEPALRDELAMLGANWAWFSKSISHVPRRVGPVSRPARRYARRQADLVHALNRGDQLFLGEVDGGLTQQVVLLTQQACPDSAATRTSGMRMQMQVNGELGWLQLGLPHAPRWPDFPCTVTQPSFYRNFQRVSVVGGDTFNRRVGHAFRKLQRNWWRD